MTAQELKDLAVTYQRLARALVDSRAGFVLANDAERDAFNKTVGDLDQIAQDLMNRALLQAVLDVNVPVAELRSATDGAVDAIKTVDTVSKVFSVAGAAIGLGTSLVNPTPEGVAKSVGTLVDAIQKAAARSSSATGSEAR